MIQSELEKAGHKPQKGEAGLQASRKRVLDKYFGVPDSQQFADPALLFA